MKKYIVSILFIGIIAMISMGFQSSSSGGNGSGSGSISVSYVHGDDADGIWNVAQFRLIGFDSRHYKISAVEILNAGGGYIATVDRLYGDYIGNDDNTMEYKVIIDLERYRLPSEIRSRHHQGSISKIPFGLRIHIIATHGGGGFASVNTSKTATALINNIAGSTSSNNPTAPTTNVPDETTITVKYP